MAFKKHNPGCPCCDICQIPIAGWSEESGDWELSNQVHSTNDDNALLVTTNEHPDGLSTHVLRFTFQGDDEGDVIRAYLCYEDSDNYLMAEFEIGPSLGDGKVRMYQKASGTLTELGDELTVTMLQKGMFHEVWLCYDGEHFSYTSYYLGSHRWEAATATGKRIGIGTGAITAQAQFAVAWARIFDDPDEPTCRKCHNVTFSCSNCEDDVQPANMKVVVSGAAQGTNFDPCYCDVYNGTQIVPHHLNCVYRKLFLNACFGDGMTGDRLDVTIFSDRIRVDFILDSGMGKQATYRYESATLPSTPNDCLSFEYVKCGPVSNYSDTTLCDMRNISVTVSSI